MPATAQATASRYYAAPVAQNRQLNGATQAGIEAMITPAELALVELTPSSHEDGERKLLGEF